VPACARPIFFQAELLSIAIIVKISLNNYEFMYARINVNEKVKPLGGDRRML
jgi:hypothetical protein